MVAAEDLKCRGDFSSDAPARVGLQIFNEAIYNTRFETAKSTSALVDKNYVIVDSLSTRVSTVVDKTS
jgi:hypothetical protein